MFNELNFSLPIASATASVTSVVASDQISTAFWMRSPSVMTPRRKFRSTFSVSSSNRSRIDFFDSGVFTSEIAMVRPDLVDHFSVSSFKRSRLWATVAFG